MNDRATDGDGKASGKNFISYGTRRIEVVDPLNIQPVPADCLTDLKVVEGMVWLSLGHFVQNGDGELTAVVNTRLRMPLPMTTDIQNFIEGHFADVGAKTKKGAN